MIEILFSEKPAVPFKAAVLDFDGTISLIREGWQQIMIPYFNDVLLAASPHEAPEEILRCVHDFVDYLTGKQTIYQCIQLAEEITKRGGTPLEPLEYKHEYLRRLMLRIDDRLKSLRTGRDPREHVVPGSYELLDMLKRRGLTLYLASGTEEYSVKDEAALLQVDKYFDGGIYGAQDDYKKFSKAMVIQKIITEHNLGGPELLGFGDGYVEIENVRQVGGVAIGVATNESERKGLDEWKRNRLTKAGANAIIPDYSDITELENFLFGD